MMLEKETLTVKTASFPTGITIGAGVGVFMSTVIVIAIVKHVKKPNRKKENRGMTFLFISCCVSKHFSQK